jgi:bifunctional oligoribonuclease and PAP phosphatase NrnA
MKRRLKIIDRILEALKDSKTVGVVGHTRPDGDCIGSQLGLAIALQNQGKKVSCWNDDEIPEKLAFLDLRRVFQKPRANCSFDCVIALDSANLSRLGHTSEYIQHRRLLINIDHHESNSRFGDINWVSAQEPSTGELVYRFLKESLWPITQPIADCLFAAVSTDTGSFQYPTTRPTSFLIAAALLKQGANVGKICEEVYQSFPLSRVRLLQHVFNHFRLTLQNQVGYFWLKPADFVRTGASPSDSEGLIDHIRAIEPVVVACVFEELEPELIRVSLRSKNGQINVNEVASQFGGGGHPAAAGARIRGRPFTVQRRVLAAIKKVLNLHSTS